jgi:hypothetical protein
MSRLSKFLSLTFIVVFLLACNFVSGPVRDAQNLAETAQSVATLIPIETLQALPSAIPAQTLQALPSAIPTLGAIATDFGNFFDPQGTPALEWRGIPIFPQATAGQEFAENDTYSFRANVTPQEIQEFYNEQLSALGWSQPFTFPLGAEGGLMFLEKDGETLTITVTSAEGAVVVLLLLA